MEVILTKSKIKKRGVQHKVVSSARCGKTKCIQSARDEQNINYIVSKAVKTGMLPVLMSREPMQALPDVDSYQDALNRVVYAQQEFEKLPSLVRREFGNDPSRLLEALSNPKENLELLKRASVLEPVHDVVDPILQELKNISEAVSSPIPSSEKEA